MARSGCFPLGGTEPWIPEPFWAFTSSRKLSLEPRTAARWLERVLPIERQPKEAGSSFASGYRRNESLGSAIGRGRGPGPRSSSASRAGACRPRVPRGVGGPTRPPLPPREGFALDPCARRGSVPARQQRAGHRSCNLCRRAAVRDCKACTSRGGPTSETPEPPGDCHSRAAQGRTAAWGGETCDPPGGSSTSQRRRLHPVHVREGNPGRASCGGS